jgi:ATP-dependent exoDNAse (exonuclease V) beta subunit
MSGAAAPDTSVLLTCGISVKAEQAEVIRHLAQHTVTVVSAGAGVGKTYTFVAAVLELVAIGRAQANEFVLITFTNQAADEIRDRLQKAMQARVEAAADDTIRRFWTCQRERLALAFLGTIHGFCRQILDLHGYTLGLAREASVTFAREMENRATVEAVVAALAGPTDPLCDLVLEGKWPEYDLRKRLLKIFRHARNLGLGAVPLLEATRRQPDDDGKPWRVRAAELVANIEARYEASCRQEQKYDPSALLLHAAALLNSADGNRIVRQIRQRFCWLFVDEFQDTSATQEQIVSAFADEFKVLVVGDRKQAIYNFAGANVALLDDFAAKHKTRALPLRSSGRPSRPLLAAQNALFASMRQRFRQLDEPLTPSDRNLVPADALPPMVVLLAEKDELDPVRLGAARIRRLIGQPIDRLDRPAVMHADIAVLVRTNSEVDAWLQALRHEGVECCSDAGMPFLRRPEVVAVYRLLQLLLRYPDDVALVEALATPSFAEVHLEDRVADVLTYGVREGTELCDAYERQYQDHARRLLDLRRISRTATVPQLLARVDTAFGLKARYRAQGDEAAALGLDRLRDYARNRFESDQALTLRIFLDILRRDMLSDLSLPEPGSDAPGRADAVRVMTIHRAKGLEFPIVVIPNLAANRRSHRPPEFLVDPMHGLELNLTAQGVDSASLAYRQQWTRAQQRTLAEEMRLFYVAVTRAERMVVMLGQEPEEEPPISGRHNHGWQHEIVAAKDALRVLGARVGPLRQA